MALDPSYIYAVFAIISATLFFIVVPKQSYRHCLLYGIIFGGVIDVFLAVLLTWFNLIKYKNMGAFNILNLFSSWTPITWTFIFGLFFYLLPKRKFFLIPYILSFAAFTFGVGLVFKNFGLYEYIGFWKYIAPFIFLAWYSFSAWYYVRHSNVVFAVE